MAASVILLFPTTQAVLKAEDLLLESGFAVDVIPRPAGTSGALCGIALALPAAFFVQAEKVLAAANVGFTRHRPSPGGRSRVRARRARRSVAGVGGRAGGGVRPPRSDPGNDTGTG
ncbi:MAG: DUF3343 domain-containing protein [Actinobacteria bacterium]|nr:DUF3343 domain-containing protein [Actinomycetota bacterium]